MDDDTFGGIAAVGDYVFATDDQTGEQTAAERGIVRYNLVTQTFERFHADADDPIDITVGLDGLLYTLSPVTAPIGTIVRQYHPQTMGLLAEITLPASHRAIAVDANGDIFAVSPEIHHYNSAGVQVQPPLGDGGVGGLSDVDIDRDGRLLVASQDGHVLLTDRALPAWCPSSRGPRTAATSRPSCRPAAVRCERVGCVYRPDQQHQRAPGRVG